MQILVINKERVENDVIFLHSLFFPENRFRHCMHETLEKIKMSLLKILSTLRKHAYSNMQKILPPKNENIQIKILIFLLKTQILITR